MAPRRVDGSSMMSGPTSVVCWGGTAASDATPDQETHATTIAACVQLEYVRPMSATPQLPLMAADRHDIPFYHGQRWLSSPGVRGFESTAGRSRVSCAETVRRPGTLGENAFRGRSDVRTPVPGTGPYGS